MRLSYDSFARNDKRSSKHSLQTRKVLRCWKDLQGVEGAKFLEGVTLLGGVELLNGSKY